jgi:hypothetical protein
MAARVSRLRQQLVEAGQRHLDQIELILAERGPFIRGSFGTRSRVCGKPGCHCVDGPRHESKYLAASQDGRLRQIHVPAGDVDEVAEGVGRYRQFREAEAKLVELSALQLQLVDDLGQALLKPYPPQDPVPPRSRRGRRPKR